MSISSWFFGKKKSPTSTSDDHKTNEERAEEADEFVVIERRNRPGIGPPDYMYPHLPYALGPGTGQAPPQPHMGHHGMPLRAESIDMEKHMLMDVPFTLSSQLTGTDTSRLQDASMRVNDVLFRVSRMDRKQYDYDFTLESSIASERG